jgi:putative intracellular protease/amidase
MNKSIAGTKIAILIANGFNEQDMTLAQRALQAAGAHAKIISVEQGLVNGWTGNAWGHNFAVDMQLSSALAADFDRLVIPGGKRSLEKLKLTAHTKRFIGGFMDTGKPVAAFDDALEILAFTEKLNGRIVSGSAIQMSLAIQAGAQWSEEPFTIDRNLLSGRTENPSEFIEAIIGHFDMASILKKAA